MASDIPERPKWIKALIFGRYKTGKTRGALTFPRINMMDFDKGANTRFNPAFIKKYGFRKYIIKEFKETDIRKGGIANTANALDDASRYFDTWMAAGKRDEFDSWIIDSATTLSDNAMNKAVIFLGGKKLSHTHEDAKKEGILFPKIQDWGAERSLVEQFIRMVLDVDKHVIVICHEKELTDDGGNLVARVPLLTGKSVDTVPLMFDEVYRTVSKVSGLDLLYRLQTVPDSTTKVGSRLGVPTDIEWDFDTVNGELDKIWKEIHTLAASQATSSAANKS